MIIRKAVAEDSAALAVLYCTLSDHPSICVLPERLDRLAHDLNQQLLVVDVKGEIVATAHLMFCPDAMFGLQPYALIENVVVASSHRNRGVGSALFTHIQTLCTEQDCSKVMLLSSATRSDAHRFFTRQGFSADHKRGFVKYRSQF